MNKDGLFEILKKYDKITYNELPFKSIISDIRSILPKKECKKIKKILKYIEEIKELTTLQIKNIKNSLIKVKSKKNNRIKKADKEYYEYEENNFYGLKYLRNLFDQNDDDDFYEEIKYFFNENGLEYEEIKKLMSVKVKKEYVRVIHGRIEQEEAIEYKVEYCEVNYYEYEHKQEVDCIKSRPFLIGCEYIVCEIIEDHKVEYCKIIEDQRVEYCEVEDINMLKSDEIKKLNLSKKELRLIARERGVKNYENISKSRLIKDINKLKPSKGLKKEEKPRKIVGSLLLKGKSSIGFKPRKKAKKMFTNQQRLVMLLVIILLNTKVIVKKTN